MRGVAQFKAVFVEKRPIRVRVRVMVRVSNFATIHQMSPKVSGVSATIHFGNNLGKCTFEMIWVSAPPMKINVYTGMEYVH